MICVLLAIWVWIKFIYNTYLLRLLGRHKLRDSTLILIAYRHGLRISELVALRWSQIDFTSGTIYINRLKHDVSSTHPLRGIELREGNCREIIQTQIICLF
ncbi:tyrosine-type recombinase/integrase [Pleurocapsa sp. FMAR1]|uniref:tyrosine-type recombinase/integrase n=1 Tax=Pleurocapsa sp. FMAR1 TaxID=3040204 RepID=UPI0029C6A04D|nr:tyrosine-type recombinase/integrase [Pleurocapsa sp. FMAR1]